MAILAGQRIRALDFAGYASVFDSSNDDPVSPPAGTWAVPTTDVGVSFMAPSSGAVKCEFGGRIRQYSGGSTRIALACELRTGAVIGSGVQVDAPDADRAIEIGATPTADTTAQAEMSNFRIHSGLTPGALYHFRFNVLLASAGTGAIYSRYISVTPWHG